MKIRPASGPAKAAHAWQQRLHVRLKIEQICSLKWRAGYLKPTVSTPAESADSFPRDGWGASSAIRLELSAILAAALGKPAEAPLAVVRSTMPWR